MKTSLVPSLGLLLACATAAHAQTPCGSFEVTTLPTDPDWWNVLLEDVTTLPGGEAWAVGYFDTIEPVFQIETFTLAMHWDGDAWTQVPTPSPSPYPGGTQAILHGVDALAPDDVWAGGEARGDAGGLSIGPWLMVQHWDGSSWEIVPTPEPPGGVSINFSGTRVIDVEAIDADDVWFGGQWGEPNAVGSVTWRPLAMRWDGSDLTVYDTPAPQEGAYGFKVESLDALGPDDVWAACTVISGIGQTGQNVVLHFDGDDWSQESIPDSSDLHILHEVVALAPDDVWVLGIWYWTGEPFALHYDGSSWSEVDGGPTANAAVGLGTDIYAGNTVVELFDGTDTVVASPLPGLTQVSIRGMAADEPCTVWAVGRANAGSGLDALAVRMSPAPSGPWTGLGQGLAGVYGVPVLEASGALTPGSAVTLVLSGALEGAPTMLVLGLSAIDAPFKGGVLVPAPDLVVAGLPTSGSGGMQLAASWPSGVPSQTALYVQHWVLDPAGLKGFSASDALGALTP